MRTPPSIIQQSEALAPLADAPLSPHWAFVVQLRVGTDVKRNRIVGRVEHVVSGQATRFQSVEDLLAFMARVLKEIDRKGVER